MESKCSNINSNKIFKENQNGQSRKKSNKKYEGYNLDFSQEKSKLQKEIDKEFKDISDKFEIIQLLGKGSYGIVIKVYFLILGKR